MLHWSELVCPKLCIRPTSPEVADWKRARWKVKGVDTNLGRLLCMLLAVMHQSVSQSYHYSDCTQRTHTIQIKSWGVQDIEERGSDVSDLFNRCWTLWAGSESILANWCDRLLWEPVQCPSHLPQNSCNICTIQLFTYAPMVVLVMSGFTPLCLGYTESILQKSTSKGKVTPTQQEGQERVAENLIYGLDKWLKRKSEIIRMQMRWWLACV